ncbi:hypothetical protein E2C01_011398 [Portunus trituberculatus]|uniref:Uncharacterized protein n=1 Tax=Portunus trituberculatus TaxID=210409 RepID=A0A5B7DB99_PORTR|nr:hypothetical protein [Portunus trituberculatus]
MGPRKGGEETRGVVKPTRSRIRCSGDGKTTTTTTTTTTITTATATTMRLFFYLTSPERSPLLLLLLSALLASPDSLLASLSSEPRHLISLSPSHPPLIIIHEF